jgi:hypothetical protein
MKKKRIRHNASVKNPTKPVSGRSLLEKFPELALEWDYEKNYPLRPENLSYGTTYKVWWICPLKHNYQMGPNSRTNKSNRHNCPYCSKGGNRVWKGNSLMTKNPILSKEWNYSKNSPLTPNDVTSSSAQEVWWICKKCQKEWKAVIDHRNRGGRTCPLCNNFGILYPKLAKEWHPTKNGKKTPFDFSGKSGKRVWWKCQRCHGSWATDIHHRVCGTGCPLCKKGIILKNAVRCDSYIEAFYYLMLRRLHIKFLFHGLYGGRMGNSRYDFYLPDINTYIEVTSYREGSIGWKGYCQKIKRKRCYVSRTLKQPFVFVQRRLSAKEIDYVEKYRRRF